MSSGVAPGATRSFASADEIDFSSSAGIQQLLGVVRKTPLSRFEYNELRDLILSYRQKGADESIKAEIIAGLTEVGIIGSSSSQVTPKAEPPTSPPAKETAADATKTNKVPLQKVTDKSVHSSRPSNTQGNRTGIIRPRPTFSAQTNKRIQTSAPNSQKPPVSPAATPVSPTTAPKQPPTSSTVPHSVPAEPEPETSTTAEVAHTVSTPTAADETSASQSTTPAPAQRAASAVTYSDPLERVKQIKREVNLAVGNPVNLIDANNEVGREYMNALLDAMKKINGSQTAQINPAMERLERAFVAVQSVTSKPDSTPVSTEKTDTPKNTDTVSPTPAPTPDPISQSPSVSSPVTSAPTTAAPHTPVTPQTASVTASPAPNPVSPSLPATETTKPQSIRSEPAPQSPELVAPESAEPFPEAQLPKSRLFAPPAVAESEPTATKSSATPPAANPVPKATPTAGGSFQSVAAEKEQMEAHVEGAVADAKAAKAREEAEISRMDPLLTPDVTSGLEQLLSEWKLFKSSGIFGTGPNGAEHPLYKQLGNLQMSQVIAGRFEGATPEIKQSITDYMNGWRYEEGIIHEHGETFEHYLRRVIKKILDRKPVTVE